MRRISILSRFILSVTCAILFIGATAMYFTFLNYNFLIEQRKGELQRQVEIAKSLVQAHIDRDRVTGKHRDQVLHEAFSEIEKLRFSDENYFYVLDGTVIRYHGGMPHLKGWDMANVESSKHLFNDLVMSKSGNDPNSLILNYSWMKQNSFKLAPKLGFHARIPDTDYWLGTGAYIDDIEALFWTNTRRAASVTIILTVLLLTISYIVSLSVTKPLKLVRRRMIALAEGESDAPVPEVSAPDEVGDMARAVEVFRRNQLNYSKLEEINTQIEKEAHHDPLTGLANRRYLESYFERLKESCEAKGQDIVLFHVDLDHFKETNDTLGHAAGDAALKHTAHILQKHSREQDFIARVGGDEFLIVGPCDGCLEWAEETAADIVTELSQPFDFENNLCRIGASIGIAMESARGVRFDRLNHRADMALYKAKDSGRNRFEFFSKNLESELKDKHKDVEEFLDGLDLGQLVPHYQPQFDTQSLDLVGIEVLARWLHPRKGILEPNEFLRIAQDQKVMAKINQAITVQALRDCMRLQCARIYVPRLSVNFSTENLKDPNLSKWLNSLKPFPTKISLELIKTFSNEADQTIICSNLKYLREHGIAIEIDDFGANEASIMDLLHIKPQRLKLDRGIIAPVDESSIHRSIIRSIVDVSNSLNMSVIAEGVETTEQIARLQELGVPAFQGYVIAAPMAFNDLREFLHKESWKQAA